ncbi:unnamed protein product [Closterium sp. NIES-53]
MALLRVLAFDHEGRQVAFDTWHNDLQLYLLSDIKDSVSLFDHVSGVAPALPATADRSTRSQTAQALYNAVVARYSSHATAALGRLLLPYLFPELSAFATEADLVTHLRTSDARYRTTVRATVDPTSLTVDLLKQHLLAAETSAVATSLFLRTSVLLQLARSAVAARARVAGVVEVAALVVEVAVGAVVGAAVEVVEAVEVVAAVGPVAAVGALLAAVEAAEGVSDVEAVGLVVAGLDLGVEAMVVVSDSSSSVRARPSRPSISTCGKFHTEHRCFSRLDDAWRIEFGDDVERPRWTDLLRSGVAIFDLDYDAIISAMYALSFSTEGDCYRCVPPDPGIAVAALGANASGTPPGTAPAEALHTITLDSGASRCFFRESTTLTPLPTPIPVRLADPSGGPVVASSSTVLPCPTVPSGSLPGLHLPSFSTNLVSTAALHDAMVTTTTLGGSSLYTLATGPPQVAASAQVSTSGQGRERYFLLVVDDFSRYTTVFPLRSKGERRIGLVMEVARTSMIHTAAPHFLWPFAVRYAAHQLNLWPRVFLPETLPTLRWTGKVGNASVFQVWGSRAFVCDTSADKLSARAIPWVFLGFVPDAPGWQFYHPTSRHVLPSQDIMFDESVPFYRLFPYRSAPPPPPPLFLAPAIGSGAAPGAASGGAEPGGAGSEGAGSGGAEPGGAEPEVVEPGGAELEGAESGGVEPRGATLSGGPAGASPRLSSHQLREWLVLCTHRRSGAPGAGGTGDTGAGGAAVTTGAGATRRTAATGPGGARTSGAGAAGTGGVGSAGAGDATEPGTAGAGGAGAGSAGVGGPGVGGAGAAGSRAVDPGAGGARGTVRTRPYFVPLLHQVLAVPSSTGLPSPFLFPPPDQSQPPLQPTIPLPAPPESSLPKVPDPASNNARTASPTVARLLATAVTDPTYESASASALVDELLDFAAACRLDYATSLVVEYVSASPLSVGGECALGMDVLEDKQEDFECLAATVPRFASMLLAPKGDLDAPDIPTPRSYAEAITGPYSSQWQVAMDAEMASWKSTCTYIDEVPPSLANIVDGMWIFRVKRAPGSPPPFKARYVARGFSQRQGVDYFQTFSPTPKMTTLWVLLHVAAQRDYELHSLDFSTAFLLRRPVYGLPQAPREWHNTLRTTLADLGFAPSTADPSLFLRTDTSLPTFYVLVYLDNLVFATANTEALTLVKSELQKRHTCTDLGVLQRFGFQFSLPQPTPLSTSHLLSAPPSDESVEPSGPYPELVGCLITSGMGLVLGGRGPIFLTGHADASWVDDSATQRSSQGYTFSLGSSSVSWRSTRSSSVLSSTCEAEIYARAMAAQELRWQTYLLTDLEEQPRLPPCGQLRLAYVATRANTADVFTKVFPPGDHQRFATVLGLVLTLPHLLTA